MERTVEPGSGPILVLGCGLVGASAAAGWTAAGHEVWGHDRRDLTPLVVPDLLDLALGAAEGTDPVDWLEGADLGATLEPQSLFEDQLARRLAR